MNQAASGSLTGTSSACRTWPRTRLVPRGPAPAPVTYRPWLVCQASGFSGLTSVTVCWPAADSAMTTRPVPSPIV
jgi:hypothetical protein